MFGDRVFEAVLASGDSESGVSLHVVDEHYDTGAVMRQARVRVEAGDSVASLKARTQECERELVVQALAAIALGELRLDQSYFSNTDGRHDLVGF